MDKARKDYEKARKSSSPGEGSRFRALTKAVAAGDVKDPAAVAAAIGRKKYGKERMAQMAAKGRKKK